MKNIGKPYAGKPHVRFDEGAVAIPLLYSIKENKIRGYKTVEINGFYDLKDLKRRFSIKKIPCGNILIVKIVGVCRQDRY